jgi:hypothetical protein
MFFVGMLNAVAERFIAAVEPVRMEPVPLSASLRSAPLPHFAGARNRCRNVGAPPAWVPRPREAGERCRAQRDGEGAFRKIQNSASGRPS